MNDGSISFGQVSGYIVFCTVLILGAKPPLYKDHTVSLDPSFFGHIFYCFRTVIRWILFARYNKLHQILLVLQISNSSRGGLLSCGVSLMRRQLRGYVQASKANLSIFSMFLFVLQISNSSRVGFIKLRGFINATAAERVFTGR